MSDGHAESTLKPAARKLVALVAQSGAGLSAAALLEAARRTTPRLADQVFAVLVGEALAAGALVEDAGVLSVPGDASAPDADPSPAAERRGRVVYVDLESVVRTTDVEPFTDKRIFQLGAVRSGADEQWSAEWPELERFLQLPDETWEIRSTAVRERHAAEAVAPVDALTALHAFCAGADLLVTYNGTVADLPMLTDAFAREELPGLDVAHVDAYYLALALWPGAASHRLAQLCDDLGVDRTGLGWHDAVDDAKLLELLIGSAREVVAAWPADLRELVAAVCPDSGAWSLVLPADTEAPALRQPDVAAVLETQLAAHTPRRQAGPAGRQPLQVGSELRDATGRVNPGQLASIARGSAARPRPAQEQMTAAMHEWADRGVPAMVEAPTGTGKSYAVLAAALDWLAGGSDRTAIITTFTKQLQAQLADDVVVLDANLPGLGLLDSCDVVKGQTSRLSVRALVAALADASSLGGNRPRERNRFLTQAGFRELLVFITLRFLAASGVESGWTARSVDPVDLPPFFSGYLPKAVPVWLESLSQASNGEYAATVNTPMAQHTDVVREALSSHRLLLANHALMLAHLDDLAGVGTETLLIVDEAHQLEDAATSALSTVLDYRAVTNLHADLAAWVRNARAGASREAVQAAVTNLGMLLEDEQLPRAAAQTFDARSGSLSQVGSRTVTLASDYAGVAGLTQVRTLRSLMLRLGGQCRALNGAVGSYVAEHRGVLDFFEVERVAALQAGSGLVTASAESIVADIDDVVGRATAAPSDDPTAGAARTSQSGPGAPGATGDPGDGSEDDPVTIAATRADDASLPSVTNDEEGGVDEEADDLAATKAGDVLDGDHVVLGDLPPGASNRVVYASELEQLRGDLRYYKFSVTSAPIELGADVVWQQFLATFARTYYVSATLRVAGRWDFIRTRLGLGGGIATLALDTPFDMGQQARLVCFSDFPSWAEQSEGAMRTVAHQLAGYADAVVTEVDQDDPDVLQDPDDLQDPQAVGESRGGFDGGALVLTTARSTAGGIAEYLATDLRRRQNRTPVRSALVLGNRRGVDEFKDREYGGGFLVGTRGLWQGVDIDDEARLRVLWINKLPFAPFADPVIEARRAVVTERALAGHAEDPDAAATSLYYLPLAALQLRQAAGRLIRSERHRGVIIISDRKLAGATALRRAYRRTFLGSLDPELLLPDLDTGERGGGNVVTMADGWARIWSFFAEQGLLSAARAAELSTPDALEEHTLLPYTRQIRRLAMTPVDVDQHRAAGTLEAEVLTRAAKIGGLLALRDEPADLKTSQQTVISAVAAGRNVLGLLPTGFGKSYCFQLPALVLPGVTIVVSPLVALMTDQALSLNRSVGGAVRALVAPLRESSSRAGKTEVADQLLGRRDHGIRMVYVSPERLTQRRFRELVRSAVASGVITRIALDEAHTFVQWDDFRPSMGRVEMFLAQLRAEHGLAVTALTATANRTVQAGLREGVFGLTPDVDADTEAAEGASADGLLTVRENPIRPELAIFRRSIAAAGPAISGGLAEEVASAVTEHAIFYCLTVKEVVALSAHLRDFLGDGAARVRRFHGRLTEAEKSSVLTEFREAPKAGEEGFAPLIVVATSAFGLGIDRPDVRTVYCASAPTDLASLYQQVGRSGRDAAGKPAPADGDDAPANVGLALLTGRGLRTARFMTSTDLKPALLHRMGQAVLASGPVLNAARVADTLIGEDVTAGRLDADEAAKSRTADEYAAGLVRAFAALAALHAVDDLGDFPPHVAVKAGELLAVAPHPSEADHGSGTAADPQLEAELAALAGVEATVVAAVLALPVRTSDRTLHRARLSVARLDTHLTQTVPGYRLVAEDAASTWQLLADLHDRGVLDVSAAPSRRLVSGLRVHTTTMPPGFGAAVSGKAARAAVEIGYLQDFFSDSTVCANRKLADYFGVADLPPGCCSHAGNRCSACWARGDWPAGQVKPKVADALETPKPRPAGTRTDAAFAARRLDDKVYRLVWDVYQGVHVLDLQRALRGDDSHYNPRTKKRRRLRTALVNSRHFGSSPSVRLGDIEDSLARLQDDDKVVQFGSVWRYTGHVAREAAKAAQAAAAAAAAGSAA
ncbi:DEAD/DEAH box helicase [Microlunatus flavus]|uniref:Helicase conserved C-terminal domain-containing protein n=1 Tax=Microlunatus flavus TaxID=1036181 RepID=A0A1H9IJW3_9ACTN|nr:DEAD/DEAH box helicase [Microlunatus flavus]SEQ74884.1 Helicase conserved C-terminal domain-containing protein [Microlunatus flavus]